jgi:hypothetical protein
VDLAGKEEALSLIPDENTAKEYGDGLSYVYLRASGANGEGGYEVRFPDGRRVRVVPDGIATTRRRLTAVQKALVDVEVGVCDPFLYLVGVLAYTGLAWEEIV